MSETTKTTANNAALSSGQTPPRDLREHLAQIRPANEPIIARLWEEHRYVQTLEATIARATREMNEGYTYVERARLWDDDDDGVATMVYWDTYFGADKEQHDSRVERDTLEQQLAVHSEKRAVESAALLQMQNSAYRSCMDPPAPVLRPEAG